MTTPLRMRADDLSIDRDRLLGRITALGAIGRDEAGRLVRLAGTDADKAGRDQVVSWFNEAGLDVMVDQLGNLFGVWRAGDPAARPVLIGSHIDTVIDAGVYDGAYGVLTGLSAIEALQASGFAPARPLAVAAFTNEEGVRFAPDMMGSLVHAGGLGVDAALASKDANGVTLGAELVRIGYAGPHAPGFLMPHVYLEVHIEQGPVLESECVAIGAVEGVQGISWRRITFRGEANHAGTTPMTLRRDAGTAAVRIAAFVAERARASSGRALATVGCLAFEPGAINVIPANACLTVDLRSPDKDELARQEAALDAMLGQVAREERVEFAVETLARFEPVRFDPEIVALVEKAALARGLNARRMVSGAGHDAQMMARIAPTAMIFVPSAGGISHNPSEHTKEDDLIAGARILLDVVAHLAS